jgi:hypothetical protein
LPGQPAVTWRTLGAQCIPAACWAQLPNPLPHQLPRQQLPMSTAHPTSTPCPPPGKQRPHSAAVLAAWGGEGHGPGGGGGGRQRGWAAAAGRGQPAAAGVSAGAGNPAAAALPHRQRAQHGR